MNISTFCDIVITNGLTNFILVTIRNSEKITRQGKQMALCSLTNYKRAGESVKPVYPEYLEPYCIGG